MDGTTLRALQAPIKQRYREDPDSATITLHAHGQLGEDVQCSVETARAMVTAGLHPGAGGDGLSVCSGDMLLQALVACAGVTLGAVATALGVHLRAAALHAEGDLDFRGTLGLDRETPVGFRAIRLRLDLDTDADAPTLDKLLQLTERYCVVWQTLAGTPALRTELHRAAAT